MAEVPSAPSICLRRPVWVAAAWGCVLGAVAAGWGEVGRMACFHNQHTVAPGLLYRSAQLDAPELRAEIDRKGIRTLINLRGYSSFDWYVAEATCTAAAGVSQEDVTLSATRLPSPHEVRRLIEVFDRCEYPVLIHCQQGADRTGLAAAVWEMLYTDACYETARGQCSPRYGHFRAMETARVDEFFDQYEAWLAARGDRHSAASFRAWAAAHYKPGPAWATLELAAAPAELPADQAFQLRLRATNASDEAWNLSPGKRAGVLARCWVCTADGDGVLTAESGLRHESVAPGETVEFTLSLPPMPRPGRYRLLTELSRRDGLFSQHGSEPLTYEWNATESADPTR